MASDVDKIKFKSSNESEETILLFTNGRGEPKAVNVDRCLEELAASAYIDAGLSDSEKNDFVYACPRVPMIPISFEFGFDASKSSSNFEYVDGFQFSYQVVYKNGSTSAIAPYSDVAIPPSIIGLGIDSLGKTDVENVCYLFVPQVGEEARSIRIIVREGNDGNPRVFDEFSTNVITDVVDIPVDAQLSAVYTFYNDKIGTILSETDSFKTFDNVPREAKAQAVADNRVMYGNYKEGYPNIETDVSLSVEFKQAPPPGYSFNLKVVPYLFNKVTNKIDEETGNEVPGGNRIKSNSGFLLDTSNFPVNVPAGTYTIDVTLTPKNNFNLFYGMGDSPVSDNNIEQSHINDVVGLSADYSTKTRERGRGGTGAVSQDKALGKNAFDGTDDDSTSPTWISSEGAEDKMDVGNSYSSPLIFRSAPISISTTIETTASVARDDFSKAILHGLCGLSPSTSPLGAQGNQIFPSFSLDNYFKEVSYDLGLLDDTYFSADNTSLSNLVTSWSTTNAFNEDRDPAPKGFFVVNKATMRFVVEPAKGYNSEDSFLIYKYDTDKTGYGAILSFAHAKNVECKTVVPIPEAKWGSAANPTSAASSLVIETNNAAHTKRARRYAAMGTSRWDWRDDNGTHKISWPSCRRMWKTPDGDFNGPAYLQHASPTLPCFGEQTTTIQNVTVRMSGANTSNAGINPTLSVQVPGDDDYHPAPIEKWLVLGSSSSETVPSSFTQSYWNSKGFQVNSDVPHGGNDAEFYKISGDPSQMLGDISKYYCGQFTENDGDGWFKLGRDIKYILPLASTSLDTYLERGTFSLTDGDFGPGGMEGMGARRFNNREDNSIWGDPLAYGYHQGSTIDANTFGRMANPVGSVTNFSLLGYRDNLPGLKVNEVVHRNSTNNDVFQLAPRNQYIGTSWAQVLQQKGTLPNDAAPTDIGFWSTYPDVQDVITVDDQRSNYYTPSSFNPAASALEIDLTVFSSPQSQSRGASLPVSGATINASTDSLGYTSYKTKANHEFGIVYYDERGRHGSVQPVGSVYVPGYDDQDRGGSFKGAAKVVMEINHIPPAWAKHYRVVYGGNTSVSEFIQYTAENAFVPETGPNKNRIYVSLNHLQGNEISYAESYGAISQDDSSKDLYKFASGDRLRIINYSDSAGNVLNTPREYDFRIVSLEILSSDMEDHVFPEGVEGNPRYNGEFLVLENNEDADGFSVFDIKNESSLWGNRCLFEIYRPSVSQGEASRRYFETNYGGEVIMASGVPTHQYNTIKMTKGDVFFRGTPVNIQTLSEGVFSSLLPESDVEEGVTEAQSNFVPYYIETEGITDLYNSTSKNYGRVHFADRFANEVLRESSISFSEKTSQGSYDLRYFSFPQIGSFKDLPPIHGQIDRLHFDGTHITSFNNNKVYRVPVSRDVLQTGGEDSIVASLKVLGTESAISFDGGSSGRPESVISINGDFFFFDSTNERLVMISSGKSASVITDINVDSYFREEVKEWKQNGAFRAPIGYDPSRSELIFSLHNQDDSYTNLSYDDARDRMITMSFDLKSKKFWKTRYTFTSPHYSRLNECLVSFHKDLSSAKDFVVPWIHDQNALRNVFFGKPQRSLVCVSSNENPSKVKEYSVLILDSDSRWEANMYTKTGSSIIPRDSFKRYNDKWYSSISSLGAIGPGSSINRSKSSDTSLRTAPILKTEKRTLSGSLLTTQFLGPRYFVKKGSEIEIRLPMPKSASILRSPIPVGKKSKIYESLEGQPSMYEIGYFGVHGFKLGAYIVGTESLDSNTEEIIVRLPIDPLVNFAQANGMSDVATRINSVAPGGAYVLNQSQNDVTGRRIFDLIFAPFYSTKFGVGAEELGTLNNIIAFEDLDDINTVFSSEFEFDLNQDGQVTVQDILILLEYFGPGAFGADDLLDLLTEYGFEPSGDVDDGGGLVTYDSAITEDLFNSIYNGERKNLHVAYQPSLNTEDLTGRYMKIELVSDDLSDDSELFEVGVDYNSRVKSVSRAVKPGSKASQKKNK